MDTYPIIVYLKNDYLCEPLRFHRVYWLQLIVFIVIDPLLQFSTESLFLVVKKY